MTSQMFSGDEMRGRQRYTAEFQGIQAVLPGPSIFLSHS
jgi:hypothetical protein